MTGKSHLETLGERQDRILDELVGELARGRGVELTRELQKDELEALRADIVRFLSEGRPLTNEGPEIERLVTDWRTMNDEAAPLRAEQHEKELKAGQAVRAEEDEGE